MVASNWNDSLGALLRAEGGNENDSRDRGGRTSHGVTQATYDAYRRRLKVPTQSVYGISLAEVSDIYYGSYWEPYCDKLPIGVDYLFFQFAVNAGPYEGMLALQEAVRVRQDGVFGPITEEAVGAIAPGVIVARMEGIITRFYESLDNPTFERGWLNRIKTATEEANVMIGDMK